MTDYSHILSVPLHENKQFLANAGRTVPAILFWWLASVLWDSLITARLSAAELSFDFGL